MGIHNIGKVIRREGESSLDSKISIEEYHDILGLIDDHPDLKTIVLTGFSAKAGAAPAFNDYLKKMGVAAEVPKKFQVGSEFSFMKGRAIRCIVVNSTSRAAFQLTFEMLEQQFGRVLRPLKYRQ